jgi:multidrug efflux system outer membrane protein
MPRPTGNPPSTAATVAPTSHAGTIRPMPIRNLSFAIAAALPLLLLTACAASPEYTAPEFGFEVPEDWRASVPGAQSVAPTLRWWETLGDPRIPELVTRVLAHNPDLRVAAERVLGADAQARIVGADRHPQVDAGFDAQRQRQNFIGLPVPGGTDVLTTRSTSLGLSLAVTWELDVWGRLRAASSAASADREAVEADLQAASLSLIGQALKAWFAVNEAHRQVELAQATVASFSVTSEQARARYERGLRPPLDLRLALTEVARAEALLEVRRATLDRVVRQLEVTLGAYPGGTLEPSGELPPPGRDIPAGLPAELVTRRPDLAAAGRRLAAAGARLETAKASLYPRFSLTASGGTRSDELADLTEGNFSVWRIGGNLLQPIFQGGRLVAGVDLAKSRQREALELYVSLALSAYREVETALAAEEYLAREETALVTAVEQSVAARELADSRYASGLEDFVTVLSAQRTAFTTESQLLAVRRRRLENRVDLHLALGGGYEAPHGSDASPTRNTASRVEEPDVSP